MLLSTAAVSGSVAPITLKISGLIQTMEILILIDSGNSHSFLSEHLAPLLFGVSAMAKPTQVHVANGNVLQSAYELLNATWSIQGFQF
jgi:hypothetical protein